MGERPGYYSVVGADSGIPSPCTIYTNILMYEYSNISALYPRLTYSLDLIGIHYKFYLYGYRKLYRLTPNKSLLFPLLRVINLYT